MREMKESGIEWIGEIPKEWNYTKLKFVSKISSGTAISKEEYDDNGQYPIFGANGVVGYCNKKNNTEEVLVTGRVGSIGFVHKVSNAWITDNALVLRVIDDIKDFACYAMKLLDYNQMISGTAMPLITAGKLYEQMIPIASTDEMHRITSFLDSKCAEIDALTADIQKEIETLQEYRKSVITEAVTKGLDPDVEMKDSGILWVPLAPKTWEISRIGHVCQKLERCFSPDDIPLLCTNKGKIVIRPEEMVGIMVSQDNAMQGIRKGDIAIHGMDTWHGSIAISNIDGKITRVVHVCNSCGDNRFIVYYLQSLAFNNVYKLISNGVRGNTSDFRSWNKVEHILIPIPNIEEQHRICDYLDEKCNEIDSIIADKQKQLETLAEYRKSLIYEYVTGKKEIPTA